MSYITSIGTATPNHRFSQGEIATFMIHAMQLTEEEARKLKALYRATGIDSRYSVVEDYGKKSDFTFFPNADEGEPFPSTQQRMKLFQEHAIEVSERAARNCLSKITGFNVEDVTHLVVVSCTGMYAPGLDIDLVRKLKLKSSVQRTCINFMGCYAAFNAMKLAHSVCASDEHASVLVVCAELCSIHFQKENTEDNWLANSLFADGAAAVLVESIPRKGINLKPLHFHCDLVLNGDKDMAWSIGDNGFEMRLSSYIPDIIREGIKKLTHTLLQQINRRQEDISYFAIHPGGKRILEVIEEELRITKEQNKFAYEVLRRYGNMSSPTVLFVLNDIYNELTPDDQNKEIVSFAFGPGLTMESMLLKTEVH